MTRRFAISAGLTLTAALAVCAAGVTMAQPAPTKPGAIALHITGVASARGTINVAVCGRPDFLKRKCAILRQVPARRGAMDLQIAPVPVGAWAIEAYHDENGNGRLDRNGLGIPTEGAGFSRDAHGQYGPPSFDDAVVQVTDRTRVSLTLNY